MKKFLVPFISLLMLPVLAQAASTCQSLVITGHPAYPPVAWASQGKIVGAAAEFVTSIALRQGVKSVTSRDFGSWGNAQEAAKSGEADVIFGIYKNEERGTYLNYIDPPFMIDPVAVAVRKGEAFAFSKWDDLRSRKGVTNAGESYGNQFDAFMAKDLTVARAQGVAKAFEALLNKQADYLIIGLYPAKNEAKLRGVASRLEFLPKDLLSSNMYIAFSKKSKCYASLSVGFAANIKTDVEQGEVKQLLDSAQSRLVAGQQTR
jgi:polar amino acid transport system substrate-binding protein